MDMSPASQALGLGLGSNEETEEQRKKRLQAIAQTQQRLGAMSGIALSPAGSALGLS